MIKKNIIAPTIKNTAKLSFFFMANIPENMNNKSGSINIKYFIKFIYDDLLKF